MAKEPRRSRHGDPSCDDGDFNGNIQWEEEEEEEEGSLHAD